MMILIGDELFILRFENFFGYELMYWDLVIGYSYVISGIFVYL